VQVALANRQRSTRLLEAVLPTLPEQQRREAAIAQSAKEISAFILQMRSLKRQAKQERREAERKSAMAALKASGGAAAMAVRQRRTASLHPHHADESDREDDDDDTDDEDEEELQLPLRGNALIDPWAIEGDDPAAALCAVCGDGTSFDGNPVVFCERCNVPVHQHCYGIGQVPEGEWLCWPCLAYAPTLLDSICAVAAARMVPRALFMPRNRITWTGAFPVAASLSSSTLHWLVSWRIWGVPAFACLVDFRRVSCPV
jgi:hypothetical protein